MIDPNDADDLYVISYLIHNSKTDGIVGYANLAARIFYLKNKIEEDEHMSNIVANRMGSLVQTTDDNILKWENLRNFIESANTDNMGSMFLRVKTQEKRPNEWSYRFESNAPKVVLEDKLEGLSERDEALKQKIINAGEADEEALQEVVYS